MTVQRRQADSREQIAPAGTTLDMPAILPDRHARSVSEHARSNVHGCQLLEEQLGSIRDVHLSDLCLVLARPALERLLGEVSMCKLASYSRR